MLIHALGPPAPAAGQPVNRHPQGGSRAFVFPSGEEGEFVRRLCRLIPQPELRQELGEINRAVALQNTEQHEAQRVEGLLRERGLKEEEIHKLLVANPARAFARRAS